MIQIFGTRDELQLAHIATAACYEALKTKLPEVAGEMKKLADAINESLNAPLPFGNEEKMNDHLVWDKNDFEDYYLQRLTELQKQD